MKFKVHLKIETLITQITPESHTTLFSMFRERMADEGITGLCESFLKNELLSHYASHPSTGPFWQQFLIEHPVFIEDDIALKPHPKISSFHLIMGFYLFSVKINCEDLASEESQKFVNIGIDRYQSFQCLGLKVSHLLFLIQENTLEQTELINELKELIQTSLSNYFSARFLLQAFTFYRLFRYDSRLAENCLLALLVAQKLEPFSVNELHNAFLGKNLLFHFDTIADILEFVLKKFNIDKNSRQMEAIRNRAETIFQNLINPVSIEIKPEQKLEVTSSSGIRFS